MEQRFLDHNVVGIGWSAIDVLTRFSTKKTLEEHYRSVYPEAKKGRIAHHVGQIWAFGNRIKVGDLVVVPLKTRAAIAIGKITSDYQYRTDLGSDLLHTRQVEWVKTDIPRANIDQDLLYSFGSFMTVCQVSRNNAENRIRHLIGERPPEGPTPDGNGDEDSVDVEQIGRDQILRHISQKFRGHELARLVEALLQSQGFFTRRSDPGPDGGVDILAASGPMGFESPKMCVQVKSSDAPVDVNVFRSLVGTMESFRADQGLLVSWGGFKRSVFPEAGQQFFRVRLWDQGDILNALLKNYDRLPEDIRAELPLKRVWALALEEER
jgi:restriction system protein